MYSPAIALTLPALVGQEPAPAVIRKVPSVSPLCPLQNASWSSVQRRATL